MLIPVILAGGSGSRLWPLSRQKYPKQLLPLLSEETLLQQTLLRATHLTSLSRVIIVTTSELRFLVAEQINQVVKKEQLDLQVDIILEEQGHGTAAAIGLAACACDKEDTLWIMSADHFVGDEKALCAAVEDVTPHAMSDLVILGYRPDYPETGYGYIQLGDPIDQTVFRVNQFIEKPVLEEAKHYVESGQYVWNGGFVFSAAMYLSELNYYVKGIEEAVKKAMQRAVKDLDFIRPDELALKDCSGLAVDYAVMEKSQHIVVKVIEVKWSDIGSWRSLYDVSKHDEKGNVVEGDVLLKDVSNSLVMSNEGLLVVQGLKDAVVVSTGDATYVGQLSNCQQVKQVVEQLKLLKRIEIEAHKTVYRPWGSYTFLSESDTVKVKRLSVKPGATLSLQSHQYRSEHWIVVSGKAIAQIGNQEVILFPNESTFIPIGIKHRLMNHEAVQLELIEVQVGSIVNEEDIIRYQDQYGRVEEEIVL